MLALVENLLCLIKFVDFNLAGAQLLFRYGDMDLKTCLLLMVCFIMSHLLAHSTGSDSYGSIFILYFMFCYAGPALQIQLILPSIIAWAVVSCDPACSSDNLYNDALSLPYI